MLPGIGIVEAPGIIAPLVVGLPTGVLPRRARLVAAPWVPVPPVGSPVAVPLVDKPVVLVPVVPSPVPEVVPSTAPVVAGALGVVPTAGAMVVPGAVIPGMVWAWAAAAKNRAAKTSDFFMTN